MAGSGNILSAVVVRPARGVTAKPAGTRPGVGAVAVPGEQGAPGADAIGATRIYPIANVASLTAAHGLPYAPNAWIVSSLGEVVDADLIHTPGAVTAIFAVPFTGTLLLR